MFAGTSTDIVTFQGQCSTNAPVHIQLMFLNQDMDSDIMIVLPIFLSVSVPICPGIFSRYVVGIKRHVLVN